jgi:Family of unknown function (DUF5677)
MPGPASSALEEAQAKIEACRTSFPVVVGEEPTLRFWAATLFCRTLDGYDAVLRLHEAGLEIEAWAHSRIALEHLLAFAWVVAKPRDRERPLKIARNGEGFLERQKAEMALFADVPGWDPQAAAAEIERLDIQGLCRELDGELAPRVGKFEVGTAISFSAWYSFFYRGASAVVHPSSVGVEHLVKEVPDGLEVAPGQSAPEGVVERTLAQVTAAEGIARATARWWLAGA